MIYIWMIIISVYFSGGLNKKNAQKNRNVKYKINISKSDIKIFLSMIPPFAVSALRYGIGTDYFWTYVPLFQLLKNGGESETFEIIFYSAVKGLVKITDNYQWLFVITSFIFCYFVFKAIYYESEKINYSVLLFYITTVFFISMNNIRQSLASALILYGLRFLKEDNIKKYIAVIIIASLVHQSMIVALIFIFVKKINIKKEVLLILSIFFYVFRNNIFQILRLIIIRIPKFEKYFVFNVFTSKTIPTSIIIINIMLVIIAFGIEMSNTGISKEFYFVLFKWNQLIILTCCMLDGLVPAAYRILNIFTFLQVILVPNTIECIEKKKYKNYIYIIVMGIFSIYCIRAVLSGADGIWPYHSILENKMS